MFQMIEKNEHSGSNEHVFLRN